MANAIRVTVIFADDTEAEAEVIGTDPGSDLAVIKVDIDPDRLNPVTIGNSDELQVGQLVAAIGNPFGLSGSMTTGIISGLGRSLPSGAAAPVAAPSPFRKSSKPTPPSTPVTPVAPCST